ncbi:hypothetical protein D3C87_1131150 [compost metagenome]
MARLKKETIVSDGMNKSFKDLFDDPEELKHVVRLNAFQSILNQQPSQDKIKQTDDGYNYIPIATVEKELSECFFGLVQYTIISQQLIYNEWETHSRIRVFHPIQKCWLEYDGVGTGMIEIKGKSTTKDFFSIKKIDGSKLAVPSSYAESVKNAAKKIGKRFGADVNRIIEENTKGVFKEIETPLN